MKKILSLLIIAGLVTGCVSNLLTGRKQLSLVPESELQLTAKSQYDMFLKDNKMLNSASSKEAAMVDRVGARISNAIEKYYASKGKAEILEGYKWEFNTVDSKEANAWCMPGGKVVVYNGILPLTSNEAGLAIVMGHEIAHAAAKHGSERMSQALIQQMGGCSIAGCPGSKASANTGTFSDVIRYWKPVGRSVAMVASAGNRSG